MARVAREKARLGMGGVKAWGGPARAIRKTLLLQKAHGKGGKHVR